MVQGQGWAADRSLDVPWDYDWCRGGQDCQRRSGSVHNCCHCEARGLHKCPHTIYICSCSSICPPHSRRGALGSLNLIPPLPTVAPSHPQEKPHLPAPMRPSDGLPPLLAPVACSAWCSPPLLSTGLPRGSRCTGPSSGAFPHPCPGTPRPLAGISTIQHSPLHVGVTVMGCYTTRL